MLHYPTGNCHYPEHYMISVNSHPITSNPRPGSHSSFHCLRNFDSLGTSVGIMWCVNLLQLQCILYIFVFQAFQLWNLFVYITKWFPIWNTLFSKFTVIMCLSLFSKKAFPLFFVSLVLSCWFIFSVISMAFLNSQHLWLFTHHPQKTKKWVSEEKQQFREIESRKQLSLVRQPWVVYGQMDKCHSCPLKCC